MNVSKDRLILQSRLSKANEKLTPEQTRAVELAMIDASVSSVQNYRESEAKAINKEAVGLIPSIVRGELRVWIRYQYLKRAKKQAQILADTENRKQYVVRKSDIAYSILSTANIEYAKKRGVISKNVGAKELHETADFVAYPARKVNLTKLVKKLVSKK